MLEIPICKPDGTPSGESVHADSPPPEVWQLEPGAVLELRRFHEVTRFGCGCISEERLGYVRVERRAGS